MVVEKTVHGFMEKVISAAGELELVKSEKDDIEALKTVANDIKAIQAAARKCTTVPENIMPEKYPGWQAVTSWKHVKVAVAKYEEAFVYPLYDAARCQAVATRAGRLLKG